MSEIHDTFGEVSNLVADKELRTGTWAVFAEYRLSSDAQGNRYVEAPPVPSFKNGKLTDNECWDYQPMVRFPDLFLHFARLVDNGLDDAWDTEINAAVALDWAWHYGVLGLTFSTTPGAWWGDVQGGREDSVARFTSEAWQANRALKLYEAATAPHGADIETIKRLMPARARTIYGSRPTVLPDWALHEVATAIHLRVARHCYPDLYQAESGDYVRAWAFRNLLGAMWLQMYFLLTSAHRTLCRNPECNRIITIEEPIPAQNAGGRRNARGKYKTRTDKKFCSKACANRYQYLTKTKPRRRAAKQH
jgi:hypothetical protein